MDHPSGESNSILQIPCCRHLYSQSATGQCTWENRPILCIPSASSSPHFALNSHFWSKKKKNKLAFYCRGLEKNTMQQREFQHSDLDKRFMWKKHRLKAVLSQRVFTLTDWVTAQDSLSVIKSHWRMSQDWMGGKPKPFCCSCTDAQCSIEEKVLKEKTLRSDSIEPWPFVPLCRSSQ